VSVLRVAHFIHEMGFFIGLNSLRRLCLNPDERSLLPVAQKIALDWRGNPPALQGGETTL